MEENKNSVGKSALISGTLLGIVLVVYTLIVYFMNQTGNKLEGYISIVLLIPCIAFLQIQYRDKENGGTITYGRVFGFAVLVVLISSIIYAVFIFIQFKIIDPSLVDKVLSIGEEKMSKRGLTSDQIEVGMKAARKMFLPITTIVILLKNMFWGTLISLISSAIIKKDPNPFGVN